MKVVINNKHGGFRLSDEAIARYAQLKGWTVYTEQDEMFKSLTHHWLVPKEERVVFPPHSQWAKMPNEDRKVLNDKYRSQQIYESDIARTDPILIQVVEELGEKCGTPVSSPKVVEVPDDVKWTIEEYDGLEWVAEVHRTWS